MKKGQVWVETVIYTLIGIAIIGLVLGVAKPKIDAKQDEILIDKSIEAMGSIDDKITAVVGAAPGNRRTINLRLEKGTLTVDSEADEIRWTIPSKVKYSEEGEEISLGNIIVETVADGSVWDVILTMRYSYNLMYGAEDVEKTFFEAATPYEITVTNDGVDETGNIIIGFNS